MRIHLELWIFLVLNLCIIQNVMKLKFSLLHVFFIKFFMAWSSTASNFNIDMAEPETPTFDFSWEWDSLSRSPMQMKLGSCKHAVYQICMITRTPRYYGIILAQCPWADYIKSVCTCSKLPSYIIVHAIKINLATMKSSRDPHFTEGIIHHFCLQRWLTSYSSLFSPFSASKTVWQLL